MNKLTIKENLKKYAAVEKCPIRNIISHFSGKWSMLILCVLAENRATRFNEISKAVPDISPKVLTETLRNLVQTNLVERQIYAEVPPRVEYSLSALGQSLNPHLYGLIEWALDNSGKLLDRRKPNA